MLVELIPLLGVGLLAGVTAGLLGVGGGIIIVPGLAFLLAGGDVTPERLMHVAVGTSLACIVVTSVSSMLAHHRRAAVRWPIVRDMAPGLLAGAVLGVIIADDLASRTLAVVFGLFLLAVALRLVLTGQPRAGRVLPSRMALGAWAALIGTLSALLGIGGGTMTVPLLAWSNVPLRAAVGTAAACGLPIAVAGTAAFALAGAGVAGLPASTIGYVHWPAFLAVAPVAAAAAPLGARLAHTLPVKGLRLVFAVFIALVALRLLLG